MSDESPIRHDSAHRRASIAPGTKLSEMFGGNAYNGSIAAAAANASAHQRRRMSISTLGLSGSPNQTSPFNTSAKQRQESLSSTSTSPGVSGWNPNGGYGGGDESAIDDSADAGGGGSSPSPFVRRMSFGAKAMMDARSGGSAGYNGMAPDHASAPSTSPKASSRTVRKGSIRGRPGSIVAGASSGPPSVAEEAPFTAPLSSSVTSQLNSSNSYSKRTGEGFNWSDQIRSRAERSSSIASPSTSAPTGGYFGVHRSNTVATTEHPQVIKEMPKVPKAPDHFQERILKGDFYMD